MRIEIWSDVACPWCYIGKRRLERALADAPDRDAITVEWRSFQLDPTLPRGAATSLEASLAAKYGATAEQVREMNARVVSLAAAEGLDYRLDRYRVVNTFDAHRVAQLGKRHGLGDATHERLLRAQLVDGEDLEDAATLVRLGAAAGLDGDEVRSMLGSDDCAAEVNADIAEAAALGISGVPFFVLDRRYGVSGAQSVEHFRAVLAQVREAATAG